MEKHFTTKPRVAQISRLKLSCHRSAQGAEFFDMQIKKQYLKEHLSDEIQNLISYTNFPLVIKKDKNNYHYISGWNDLKIDKEPKTFVILVDNNLDDTTIKNISWSYVISNQMRSWHRSLNLASMVKLLESCPQDILDFQKQKTETKNATRRSSMRSLVEFLSNESRAVVRNQLKTSKEINPLQSKTTPTQSFFEKITKND